MYSDKPISDQLINRQELYVTHRGLWLGNKFTIVLKKTYEITEKPLNIFYHNHAR